MIKALRGGQEPPAAKTEHKPMTDPAAFVYAGDTLPAALQSFGDQFAGDFTGCQDETTNLADTDITHRNRTGLGPGVEVMTPVRRSGCAGGRSSSGIAAQDRTAAGDGDCIGAPPDRNTACKYVHSTRHDSQCLR